MKVVIMFFVIFIFWAIGENIANNSKNKILFYKNYIKFAKFLKINIYSYNDNISCVMDKYISSIDGHKDKLHFKNLKKEITVPCHQKDNISDI